MQHHKPILLHSHPAQLPHILPVPFTTPARGHHVVLLVKGYCPYYRVAHASLYYTVEYTVYGVWCTVYSVSYIVYIICCEMICKDKHNHNHKHKENATRLARRGLHHRMVHLCLHPDPHQHQVPFCTRCVRGLCRAEQFRIPLHDPLHVHDLVLLDLGPRTAPREPATECV